MARTKHTERRSEAGPPKQYRRAVKHIEWIRCKRTFTQKTNYLRHLGVIHQITETEAPISAEALQRYLKYSKKKTTKNEAAIQDKPAEYTEADKPDSPPAIEGSQSEAGPCIRTKVRPRLPGVRSIRVRTTKARPKQKVLSEPLPTLKPSKDVSKYMSTRRKKEMAPSVMAKLVTKMPNESSDQIAAKLAERYGWTPEERRQRMNIIRGMRAAERQMCIRIRRGLPFRRRSTDIDNFLDQLEHDCQQIEAHDSDEFA